MNRKILALLLACIFVFCAVGCGNTTPSGDGENEGGETANDLKIGVILIGDENEGYTYAHMKGIKDAAAKLNIDPEKDIIWKYTVGENEGCKDAALDLVDNGCNLVISNSYGHQAFMQEAAAECPDVQFVAMTGDTAANSGLDNFANAFTSVYQSRYVSGVVAGMKLKELKDAGKIEDKNLDEAGNILVGYVGAYPYAEVVSGYTAFYLGVKSVVDNVTMLVQYTQSWFDISAESAAADALLARGCVVICQHADSTGAPSAVQAAYEDGATCFSVGYNIDMLSVAPDVALTSATNNWSVYYEYLFNAMLNGEKVDTNWSAGYEAGAVEITALGKACAEGTHEKVDSVVAALKDVSLKVFSTDSFTVNGEKLDTCVVDLTGDFDNDDEGDKEAIWDGYFHESELRSAPSFSIRIDGILELSDEK